MLWLSFESVFTLYKRIGFQELEMYIFNQKWSEDEFQKYDDNSRIRFSSNEKISTLMWDILA